MKILKSLMCRGGKRFKNQCCCDNSFEWLSSNIKTNWRQLVVTDLKRFDVAKCHKYLTGKLVLEKIFFDHFFRLYAIKWSVWWRGWVGNIITYVNLIDVISSIKMFVAVINVFHSHSYKFSWNDDDEYLDEGSLHRA